MSKPKFFCKIWVRTVQLTKPGKVVGQFAVTDKIYSLREARWGSTIEEAVALYLGKENK